VLHALLNAQSCNLTDSQGHPVEQLKRLPQGRDTRQKNRFYADSGLSKAMVLFPDVQKEAQAEIDKVVGPDRMPSWSDREHLPYIRGIVEESLRCEPQVPTNP
jgi:hypothetical protein